MIIQMNLGAMDNFSYIIYDEKTREAAVVDPGFQVDKLIDEINENSLKLKYILLTHTHFDHSQEAGFLKHKTNAKILCNKQEEFKITDEFVKDNDILNLGDKKIRVIGTPGHTEGSLCYLFEDKYLFTGDTLFTGGNYGRTDLAGGNKKKLEKSIKKILELSEEIIIYPGHNYGDDAFSTIKQEKCNYK